MIHHMLFAPTGTLKTRGQNYRQVHDQLRAEVARDELERHNDKYARHLFEHQQFKQCGGSP